MTSLPYWNKLLLFCWNDNSLNRDDLQSFSWFFVSVLPLSWQKENSGLLFKILTNVVSPWGLMRSRCMSLLSKNNNLVLRSKLLFLNQTCSPWNQKGILHLYQSFSTLTLQTFWAGWFVVRAVLCIIKYSIVGLCRLSASSTLPPEMWGREISLDMLNVPSREPLTKSTKS